MRSRIRRDSGDSTQQNWEPVGIFGAKLHDRWRADTGVTKDGDDKVSSWLGSIAGIDLVEALANEAPKWVTAIVNGKDVIRFDTNDRLASVAFTAIPQPYEIWLIGDCSGGANQNFADGIASGNRAAVQYNNTGDGVRLYAGVVADFHAGIVETNINSIEALFNGASSNVWLNGAAGTPADAGAHSLTGLTIGAKWDQAGNFLTGDITEVLLLTAAVTAAERAKMETYLANYYAI